MSSWSKVGRRLGIWGGELGACFVAAFILSRLSRNGDPPTSLLPKLITDDYPLLLFLLVAFVLARVLALRVSQAQGSERGIGFIFLLLGVMLALLGVLTNFVIGSVIVLGATLVLLSGICLLWAAHLHSVT
ncbi:MAG: hypothetical protein C4294_19550 [Nitrospiraceae bacterium]